MKHSLVGIEIKPQVKVRTCMYWLQNSDDIIIIFDKAIEAAEATRVPLYFPRFWHIFTMNELRLEDENFHFTQILIFNLAN